VSAALKTAVIYVRQSRHRDYERTASPEVQRQACRELPAVLLCDNVETFEDLDASGGGTKGRRGYLQMLDRIRSRGVDVVAAYDQSRTFRNTADALEFYALTEKYPTLEVVFVHGRFDRSPAGEFTYTTLAAAHAMERRMTAEKMRDAVHFKAAAGFMVGQVPAGYVRAADGTVSIVEAVATTIRRIFADYATGQFSVRQIAQRLNEQGYLLPSAKTAWRGDTVAQVLGNVAYIGMTYSTSRRHKVGDLIAARWQPIIEKAAWESAQRQLRLRQWSGGRPRREGNHEYVFQKLLRCTCGRKMHAQPVKGTAYHRCPGTDAADACHHLVREVALLQWAQDFFLRLSRYEPGTFAARVRQMDAPARSADAAHQVRARMKRLGQRFDWGHIDEGAYRQEWERLETLKAEFETLEVERPPINLVGILDAWNTGDPVTRRELLANLFDELDVEGGQIVGVKPRQDRAAEIAALIDLIYGEPPDGGLLGVGREGVEPPKLSRRFYRPLGSPRAHCRPSAYRRHWRELRSNRSPTP